LGGGLGCLFEFVGGAFLGGLALAVAADAAEPEDDGVLGNPEGAFADQEFTGSHIGQDAGDGTVGRPPSPKGSRSGGPVVGGHEEPE
jgi:hypothetical protein